MKLRTLTTLALLTSLGPALPAMAQQQQPPAAQQGQEMQAEATVEQTSLVLSTQEGDEFTLAQGNLIQGLQPGTKVRIIYREQDGRKMVTHIEAARQQ